MGRACDTTAVSQEFQRTTEKRQHQKPSGKKNDTQKESGIKGELKGGGSNQEREEH